MLAMCSQDASSSQGGIEPAGTQLPPASTTNKSLLAEIHLAAYNVHRA